MLLTTKKIQIPRSRGPRGGCLKLTAVIHYWYKTSIQFIFVLRWQQQLVSRAKQNCWSLSIPCGVLCWICGYFYEESKPFQRLLITSFDWLCFCAFIVFVIVFFFISSKREMDVFICPSITKGYSFVAKLKVCSNEKRFTLNMWDHTKFIILQIIVLINKRSF